MNSEISDIQEIPLIPDVLRQAAKDGKLVLFIGAGASQIAGCPGWSEFANKVLDSKQLHNVNHALLEQVQNRNLSPRIKLALARDWAAKAKVEIQFEEILHPTGWENHKNGKLLYNALNNLGRTFVTTNYDRWLDRDFALPPQLTVNTKEQPASTDSISRKVIHQCADIRITQLHHQNTQTVIHLHGSLDDPSNMVLTTRDYIKRYGAGRESEYLTDNNAVPKFLEDLFKQNYVLFIGYGLDELEILEYVILKTKDNFVQNKIQTPRHYILQGFFSHELELARGMADYFQNQCGVTLLTFLRDSHNYDQLINVIEHFAKEIPVSSLLNVERRNFMDRLLDYE